MSSTAPQGGKKLHGTVPLIIKRSLSLRKRQKVYISNSIYEDVIKDFKRNYSLFKLNQMYCKASKVARDKDCLQNVFFFLPLGIKYKTKALTSSRCLHFVTKTSKNPSLSRLYRFRLFLRLCYEEQRNHCPTYELRPTSNLFFYVFYRTGGIYYFSRHNFDPFIEVWAIWATRPPMGTSTEYKCWDQVSLILEIP